MLDRCDSFNGAIIISYRCAKLLILGYISAQVVDSKMGQLIYPLQKVNLMKFMQNEPILSEIQEKYTKIVKSANLIGFLNRLAVLRTLRTLPISQPLDINPKL